MEGVYPIYENDQVLGQAQIDRQGLYYHFLCRIHRNGSQILQLQIQWADKTENLGVPVPEGSCFVLRKKLPVSRCGRGEPRFVLSPRHPPKERFVPLYPDCPFSDLSYLENARLQYRNAQPGILLQE